MIASGRVSKDLDSATRVTDERQGCRLSSGRGPKPLAYNITDHLGRSFASQTFHDLPDHPADHMRLLLNLIDLDRMIFHYAIKLRLDQFAVPLIFSRCHVAILSELSRCFTESGSIKVELSKSSTKHTISRITQEPMYNKTLIILALLCAPAFGHDHNHPDLDNWYQTLMQPDNPNASCCGVADAYFADEIHVRDGKTYATITDDRDDAPLMRPHVDIGTEIEIPNHKLKWDRANPTGHGIVFMSRGGLVYCFVQPSGA